MIFDMVEADITSVIKQAFAESIKVMSGLQFLD